MPLLVQPGKRSMNLYLQISMHVHINKNLGGVLAIQMLSTGIC